MAERRFEADTAVPVQHLIGNTVGSQRLDILCRGLELLLRAEKLQGSLHAFVIGDAGLGAKIGQRDAAVIGKAQHAALVDRVALRGAVRQHPRHPGEHGHVEFRAQDERRMFHEQPLHGLHRDAGRGPWRAIAEGHFAGIGKAGFQRRTRLPVDDRDVMTGLGQLISGCDADNAGS